MPSLALPPSWPVNAALPIIKVQVDGVQCSALIDTGCFRSIVSADRCPAWSSLQVDMRTIARTSQACCGVRTVSILTNGGGHAIVNVSVSCERPLGYDILIRIDAIQTLGGITITPAGDVKLGGKEACAALCVDEPHFDASFDHKEKIWTARSKWTLNHAPTLLRNQIAKLRTSGESTRGNCKCGSQMVG